MKDLVSVIVPCYNERRTILKLLKAIQQQDYPQERIEVIIADGLSTDGTRDLIETFQRENAAPKIKVVDNPKRIIPAGLNRAIEQASGDVIIRLDAHSVPQPTYVARCIEVLENTGAANVGGAWDIRPLDARWIARSIARVASHPFGAGDARYRYIGKAGEVDTVPFGAFRRAWVERVGYYDESLLSNEDYEYNHRIIRAGGRIWFDPSIRSIYYARGDLVSLSRQYIRYGFWKARMLLRNPQSLRWRQALPALFFLTLAGLLGFGIFFRGARILLGVYWGIYSAFTIGAAIVESIRHGDPALLLGMPLAFWTMHISWGSAFFWGLITGLFGSHRESA
jgi:glycosyltransferase involved in cell wall biosynthesis